VVGSVSCVFSALIALTSAVIRVRHAERRGE
jgi:hypothetical protein